MSKCCDHSHEPADLGDSYSLYKRIDLENLECLNESKTDSGKTVFKPWEERLSRDKFVESDVDEELLFNIPFTGQIKLKGIIIVGGEDGHHPNVVKLFKNIVGMTFDNSGAEPQQIIELHPDTEGVIEYPIKMGRFTNMSHLSLYFPSNHGGEDVTKIFYIGLKGEFTAAKPHGVTLATYETTPNVKDHADKLSDKVLPHVM